LEFNRRSGFWGPRQTGLVQRARRRPLTEDKAEKPLQTLEVRTTIHTILSN
jgi:hypothetical protein